ncbi:CopM family metallochaperone [Psychrobacter sp. DM4]|uniref:CopM family metallochaperone n=1 Tax=Psychrobacter sp. DM4 TaxID=3440637 RepID=UPI003F509C9F
MINARLFMPLFASVLMTFMLSACQPAPQDTSIAVPEETMTGDNDDSLVVDLPSDASSTKMTEDMSAHSEHGMVDDTVVSNEVRMSARYQDYAKSMTAMHDEMMIGMGYNDPDTAFAKGMLGHHRGAIDMATIELKYGSDPYMRKLAQEVIEVQQGEVDILRKWLASHPDIPEPELVTSAMQRAYKSSAKSMHNDMSAGIADPVADMAFARAMLAHHIGAVKMARTQLKYGEEEEMRLLARNIISAQQVEVELMQDWIETQKKVEDPDKNIESTEELTNESMT